MAKLLKEEGLEVPEWAREIMERPEFQNTDQWTLLTRVYLSQDYVDLNGDRVSVSSGPYGLNLVFPHQWRKDVGYNFPDHLRADAVEALMAKYEKAMKMAKVIKLLKGIEEVKLALNDIKGFDSLFTEAINAECELRENLKELRKLLES